MDSKRVFDGEYFASRSFGLGEWVNVGTVTHLGLVEFTACGSIRCTTTRPEEATDHRPT